MFDVVTEKVHTLTLLTFYFGTSQREKRVFERYLNLSNGDLRRREREIHKNEDERATNESLEYK
jgi:hypothetical protein